MVCHYDEPVIADGPDTASKIAAALDHAARAGGIDVFRFRYVRGDTPFAAVLAGRRGAQITTSQSASIDWRQFRDWDGYWDDLRPSLKTELRRKARQLEKLGTLRFEMLQTREDTVAALDWLFHHQRQWFIDNNKSPARFETRRPFLDSYVEYGRISGSLCLSRLTLNGEMIAAELGFIHNGRHSPLILTHDPTWRKYAPGKLLSEKTLRWSMEAGLSSYDFHDGKYEYKRRWAPIEAPLLGFAVPYSRRAAVIMACRRTPIGELAQKVIGGSVPGYAGARA